jgi:hypothetical protein
MFRVGAFLPTDRERGFETATFITVSRSEALKLVLSLLSETLQTRGAKLSVELIAPKSEGDLSFITIA